MLLTAAEVARTVGGELAGASDVIATSYTMDTRLLEPGGCFAALSDQRDGHDFVTDAWRRDAAIVLVTRPVDVPPGRAAVRVEDPLRALAVLGREARGRLLDASVVGITGSAGKTSTKDLLAAALNRSRRVHASWASYNNEAGLPLTLLNAPSDTQVLVAEMGARFAGNIAELCAIAEPHVGVVTNIGLAHVGLLGDREGVARVKGELLEALPDSGVAVLDAGDEYTPALAARTRARVITAGAEGAPNADVRVSGLHLDDELRARFRLETPWGATDVALSLRGEHQAVNAALAAAVAGHLGAPIERIGEGLGEASGAAHRMQLVRAPSGIAILNDTYNASPTSMAAALEALGRLRVPGRRLAVLGEMLELGAHAEREHTEIGHVAVHCGCDVVITVGRTARPIAVGVRRAALDFPVTVIEADDADAACDEVLRRVRPGDAVLVKASRAVGLDRLAGALAEPGVGT